MSIVTFRRGDKTALTKNFRRSEFQCSCGCSAQIVDDMLAENLQAIRDKVGVPITITSGYRCVSHNKAVGGAAGSRHLYGIAADWRTKDRSINPVALGILAAEQGFGGVGIYWRSDTDAFVHSDTRTGQVWWLCTSGASYLYSSSQPFIMPTVRQGSTGALEKCAIKMLQRLLGLTADGVYGAGTAEAVRKAQAASGLTVDGICGPDSWRAISGANKYLRKTNY